MLTRDDRVVSLTGEPSHLKTQISVWDSPGGSIAVLVKGLASRSRVADTAFSREFLHKSDRQGHDPHRPRGAA
jgi:hypothetical protein